MSQLPPEKKTQRAVDLLVNRIIPPDLRGMLNTYSAKEVNNFLLELYKKYPDKYSDVSQKLAQVGLKSSYLSGSSLGWEDTEPVIDREHVFSKMDQEVDDLRAEYRNDPEEFKKEREKVWLKYNDLILKTTMSAAGRKHNAMGMAVASGARGKAQQVQAMLSSPGLYQDHQGKVIPIFVRNSFSDGLRPMELLAGSFGARSSVVSTKRCYNSLTTNVLRADGKVSPITEIKVGDLVLGSDKEGRTFPTTVKAVYDQGLQDVNRYTFRFGMSYQHYTVDCTEDHKLLINDRRYYAQYNSKKTRKVIPPLPKKEASDLWHKRTIEPLGKASKNVFATFPTDYIGEDSGINVPEALFLGLVTGDGCTTGKRSQVRFACADRSLIEGISEYLLTLGVGVRNNSCPGDKENGTDIQYVFNSTDYMPKKLAEFLNEKGSADFKAKGYFSTPKLLLEKHGLMGKYAHEKKLPDTIWEWNRESVAAYIAGLIITDGSIYKTKTNQSFISFYATSEELVRGLFDLLEKKFHIYSSEIATRLVGGFGSSTDKRKYPLYGSVVAGYGSLVNFNKWIAPHLVGVKKQKWEESFGSYHLSQENPYKKARLVKTEYLGKLPCVDLEVDNEDHLFVLGNGIIGSNSTAQGGDIGKLMGQASSRLVITSKDCGVKNGLSYDIDDEVLPGRVLSFPAGDYRAGTVLDRKAIANLRSSGVTSIVARSPLTCKADGLCSKCVGIMLDKLELPRVGDHVGATSAQALAEPLTQSALSCLAYGTLVRMADFSTKPIEKIKVGDVVLGADLMANTFPVRVTKTHNQGIQPVYKTVFKKGTSLGKLELLSTLCHKVLLNKKNTGQIYYDKYDGKYGFLSKESFDAVKLPVGTPHANIGAVLANGFSHPSPGSLKNEPMALMIGVHLGDGIRWDNQKFRNQTPRFSCADPVLIADLDVYLSQFGLRTHKSKRNFDYTISYGSVLGFNKHAPYIDGVRTHLWKAKLEQYDLAGKYSHDKKIPEDILDWDDASILALIGGYTATDGCIVNTSSGDVHVSWCSNNPDLVSVLKHVLEVRFGIYGGEISQQRFEHRRDMYKFCIARKDQVLRFMNIVAVPGIKKERQKEFFNTYNNKLGLFREFFYRAKKESQEFVGDLPCFDISVDHQDELFVLANSLIVSNSKHTAGQASVKQGLGGLNIVSQFVQSPEEYSHRATVANIAGRVEQITPAPQGGNYITVQGEQHYIPQGYDPMVKVGDEVDEGDQLSEGLMDVRDVVRHKGLGEGRKYYASRLGQILKDGGQPGHPKNLEILARGALNTVTIDDYMDGLDAIPDDAVEYNKVVSAWQPDHEQVTPVENTARNRYLSRDILHYTVGTKLNPRQIADIKKAGISTIHTVAEKPPFTSNMDRLRTASHYNDDWLASMSSSYLKKQLGEGAVRGAETDVNENSHWAPRIAYGKGFAENIRETGKF